jgi:hypothetical protein
MHKIGYGNLVTYDNIDLILGENAEDMNAESTSSADVPEKQA